MSSPIQCNTNRVTVTLNKNTDYAAVAQQLLALAELPQYSFLHCYPLSATTPRLAQQNLHILFDNVYSFLHVLSLYYNVIPNWEYHQLALRSNFNIRTNDIYLQDFIKLALQRSKSITVTFSA